MRQFEYFFFFCEIITCNLFCIYRISEVCYILIPVNNRYKAIWCISFTITITISLWLIILKSHFIQFSNGFYDKLKQRDGIFDSKTTTQIFKNVNEIAKFYKVKQFTWLIKFYFAYAVCTVAGVGNIGPKKWNLQKKLIVITPTFYSRVRFWLKKWFLLLLFYRFSLRIHVNPFG